MLVVLIFLNTSIESSVLPISIVHKIWWNAYLYIYTHPLTHSPTHPLTHSPTHPLTHSPTHPLTHSPTHPLTHSPTHPLTHSPTHPHTHTPTHPLTHSPTHPLTHSPTHPLTHSNWYIRYIYWLVFKLFLLYIYQIEKKLKIYYNLTENILYRCIYLILYHIEL